MIALILYLQYSKHKKYSLHVKLSAAIGIDFFRENKRCYNLTGVPDVYDHISNWNEQQPSLNAFHP